MLWHTIHVPVAIVKFDSELPFPYEISTPMASHPKQLPRTSISRSSRFFKIFSSPL